MDTQRFRGLSARLRALVAYAVLLDGREAALYLSSDAINGTGLAKIANEVASHEPELRMPVLGTLARAAIEELSQDQREQ